MSDLVYDEANLDGAIASIADLIELKLKGIELLKELRTNLVIARRAKVHPKRIKRGGYDPNKDVRYKKWPSLMQNTRLAPETNYVILDDGTRVDFENNWDTPEYRGYLKSRAEAAKRFNNPLGG